jgi:hypothetical protein
MLFENVPLFVFVSLMLLDAFTAYNVFVNYARLGLTLPFSEHSGPERVTGQNQLVLARGKQE